MPSPSPLALRWYLASSSADDRKEWLAAVVSYFKGLNNSSGSNQEDFSEASTSVPVTPSGSPSASRRTSLDGGCSVGVGVRLAVHLFGECVWGEGRQGGSSGAL